MNHTNRALNRTILLVVGVVLLAVGVAVVTTSAWPLAAQYWTTGTEAARTWLEGAILATGIGSTAASWIMIGIVAALAVLAAVLVLILTRVGGGRSRTLLRSSGQENPLGRVTITDAFASDALQQSLRQRKEILFSSVTAHDVADQQVMQVDVTPRQNTSPRRLVADIDHLVTNLSTLTGGDVPTYISIRSGLRAKLAQDQGRVA